jgi:hypothetical protein
MATCKPDSDVKRMLPVTFEYKRLQPFVTGYNFVY